MKRNNNLIGILCILLGGTFLFFFLKNTPTPRPAGSWIIIALFVGIALSSLFFFFPKKKAQ